jgi:cytoskeletal protein RodZ
LDATLGLLLLVVYIVVILGISAAITYAVVRIFPTERKPKNPDEQESSHPPSSTDGGGKLFRRSKRAAT